MIHHHIQTIPVHLLSPDPRNANVCTAEILKKLSRHIAETGYYPPLIVRLDSDQPDHFILVDGHHRFKVLQELEHKEVLCQVLDITDKQSQMLLATLNRLRGEDNLHRRAELIDGLTQHFEIDDLALLIPESKSEIDDLLSMLQLEESALQEKVKQIQDTETAQLPIILSFVVSLSDAECINTAIAACQPENVEDPSAGLVALCIKHHNHKESEHA